MKYSALCALGVMLLGLTACGDPRESLGLVRRPPDEFQVISRPPLTVPPDFTLRPPGTSNEVGGGFTPSIARDTTAASGAEAALLGKLPASDPAIRTQLEKDVQVQTMQIEENKSWYDDLIFWRDDSAANTIDPVAEKERLQGTKPSATPAPAAPAP